MSDDDLKKFLIGCAITTVACFVLWILVQPGFEAAAYTKLTGKRVTYWEAVVLDLRVQAPPK